MRRYGLYGFRNLVLNSACFVLKVFTNDSFIYLFILLKVVHNLLDFRPTFCHMLLTVGSMKTCHVAGSYGNHLVLMAKDKKKAVVQGVLVVLQNDTYWLL